jgi:hypothetical protein
MGIFSRLFHGEEQEGISEDKSAAPAKDEPISAVRADHDASKPIVIDAAAVQHEAAPPKRHSDPELPAAARAQTATPRVAPTRAAAAAVAVASVPAAPANGAGSKRRSDSTPARDAATSGAKAGPSAAPATVRPAASGSSAKSPPRDNPAREEAAAAQNNRSFGSITGAFASLRDDSPAASKDGVSTSEDLKAAQGLFAEVAAVHVAHVRDVMLEMRFGDVASSVIEASMPALRSLRSMAGEMELSELCTTLGDFCAAVEAATRSAAKVDDDGKARLLQRYQRLIELIPSAFELDAERDRREPIIVQALLRQVDGVENLVLERLFAVGLGKLDALMRATAEEMAVVAGIRGELAARIVAQLRQYKSSHHTAVSTPDPGSAHKELQGLTTALRTLHEDFERAASSWSGNARTRKLALRKDREQTFLQIQVVLARLGERGRIDRLERLPYRERLELLDNYLEAAAKPWEIPPPTKKTAGSQRDRGLAKT